jgi:hypothetical protein
LFSETSPEGEAGAIGPYVWDKDDIRSDIHVGSFFLVQL